MRTNNQQSKGQERSALFFDFDLLLPLTYTHMEPNQTILLHGRGLELNLEYSAGRVII